MRRRTTEMKFIVLSSLLLVCLLVITIKGTSASVFSGVQEGNKNQLEVTEITFTSAQKESFERSGAANVRKLGFGRIMHHEETSVDSENGERTPKISGASYSDGICDFEREGDHKTVKCKRDEKSIKPTRKVKMDGFVAFTADYHGPKHHLPKHN